MDLLLVPPDATLSRQRARYVCTEQWDGGAFFTYARRQGRMRTIPARLRQYTTPTSASTSDVDLRGEDEFTEPVWQTPQAEQEAFLQTWLFFGLLAEFFGLNEDGSGERLVDADTAQTEIAALYKDYVQDATDESGTRSNYLTGAPMLLAKDAPLRIVARLRLAGPNIEQRVQHLHRCLTFSCSLLHGAIHAAFDPALKTSIAALGELLSTGFATACALQRIPRAGVSFSFAWADRYLEPHSTLEQHMLARGWCISDVERIRSTHQGLGTRHYLSHMRTRGPARDHSSCSKDGCVAFQIDASTYRPSHAQSECACRLQFVDAAAVLRVLQETAVYPVLHMQKHPGADGESAAAAVVEPYAEGMPYVAISHVWAHGMGNPTANALPACQIAKVATLVSQLQTATSSANEAVPDNASGPTYRVWIDTLLCPIQPGGKKLALQRIPDVYRNATHVLVLDASLMQYSADDLLPEEILLRIFSSSAWMRRLWTLQEGALAQSLYFQFADHAVAPADALAKLYAKGLADARYMRIWQDMSTEHVHLRGWFRSIDDQESASTLSLVNLQRALHFRTVSNPADEPLCIATLLSLDQTYVMAASHVQDRMARVWALVAEKLGGSVPARVLFSSDETLDIPGWRWAPRSLLGASHAANGPVMDVHHRIMRFRDWRSGDTVSDNTTTSTSDTGTPTPWGLRVQMGGYMLRSVPLLPDLPLHPWECVAGSREDFIYVKHEASGRWLRLMDVYRMEMARTWSAEERRLYDAKADNRLCRLIDGGRQALLCDVHLHEGHAHPTLMVQLEHAWDQQSGTRTDEEKYGTRHTLRARRERMVILEWASPAHAVVADGLKELALQVANSDATTQFLDDMANATDWNQGRRALETVQEVMKAAMAAKWTSDPAFVDAVWDSRGPNMEDVLWAEIPMRFSHRIVCDDVSASQVWLVD
ncbi:hypothetical protein SPBR_01294 [Sporothrix brasiliensis 5110]|uniref:Heterokaryon incompatibility domain-containing protein n=1 Tax=Sporothrix brasiliensis 5110 TaxID=1398154 RepID=A0A0C2FJJ6_9PEZI|nr:uncharacterized protein SPBR_01294 [Sporothrix brasiliensis 5110]KIH91208.1 hypothetical protein SPBR_01294 [Sporothrix brasiliensis 5110]